MPATAAATGGSPRVAVRVAAATPEAIGCMARLILWAAMVGTIAPRLAVAASMATRGIPQYAPSLAKRQPFQKEFPICFGKLFATASTGASHIEVLTRGARGAPGMSTKVIGMSSVLATGYLVLCSPNTR